ncbi:SDR family NAD(P)-dependent oxidoreductase [Streptomyces lasiicapitis]|uniref:2-deoxy-D-gluconate 3-dehydrogenase n=1 Tax=Streptomyces lasiicapitis TaxID=1923961 RepID=A0ABQ2M8P7_9ACTN|nr:SDR family oxidoreductase [Streptomyces lasiicapitis]GGO48599.1 2-deoxy-D-gluconate 3-dehydrogenase [Streptomyces lasiicapitis]
MDNSGINSEQDVRRPVAVVTGVAQGIGRNVAEVLAAEGYALVLADIKEPTETLAAVRDAGAEAVATVGDITSESHVARLVEQTQERFGRVDVLVNNAGVSLLSAAEDTTAEQWRRVLEVNLTGPFFLCRAFGRLMLEAGGGSIVNVASIAGLHGVADRAAYNASKHGLIGLTRTLAAEWGGRGVRVNAVCPGWVKTEMDAADQASGGYADSDIVERVPMARFAAPGDIAQATAFLADAARSGFINGAALPVDGGWTADASWTSLRLRKR